jgi:hypothetical protein
MGTVGGQGLGTELDNILGYSLYRKPPIQVSLWWFLHWGFSLALLAQGIGVMCSDSPETSHGLLYTVVAILTWRTRKCR